MIPRIFHSLLRLSLAFLLIWGVFLLLGNVIEYATNWSITTISIIGAVAAEIIFLLYLYERRAVTRKRGRIILSLRLVALLGLLWMLAQPVWSRKVEKEIVREVVVLVDDSASMHLQDDGENLTRQEIGRKALDSSGLLNELDGKINVRTLRAARKVLNKNETASDGWDQATDLTAALSTVLEQVPADNLGGVILLSDGRHNRPNRVEETARRFGILDAPIGAVALGSIDPPRDAAILSVESPDAVYLGDRIRVAALLKLDGYRGKKAKLRLLQGDKVLEEKEINIPQDRHREEVRFRHTPEKGGVTAYRIELASMEGERFPDNNNWGFETAITDARTNVLIIDSHARWEFRYLRNLFYGRDKSIHLQYVLMNPDTISGQKDPEVPASAARPFGEAQATQLPSEESEWRKFDVIMIGDVNPGSISDAQWNILQNCVQKRGALLVTIAGPRWMPHAHNNKALQNLLPVEYKLTSQTYFGTSDDEYRMMLSTTGRTHPVTAQSDSRMENARLWSEFPPIRWKHPVSGIKKGAEILLVAGKSSDAKKDAAPRSTADLQEALGSLAKRRQNEAKNALLVTRQSGNGKVATLLTDRTWRLREGVGDTHHHRFWGQLVRWGAGPNLRSGTQEARLGTDQLTYTGDDQVKVTARLRDSNLLPVEDPSLVARVFLNNTEITSVPMQFVKDSNGLHEAMLGPFADQGNYSIKLSGNKLENLLTEKSSSVDTSFRVIGATSPVELSETTQNRALLEKIASLSGGRVVGPSDINSLASLFLTGDESRMELRETTLWDHWLLLLLLMAVLTAEWIARRSSGLP